MTIRKVKNAVQAGMTMIELVVVVAILGILLALVAPSLIGSKDGANSQLLRQTATSIAQNWMLLNQACGTSTTVAGSPLPGSSKTVSDVLFAGSANVAATYTNCYGQSKILPLTEVAQPGASTGVYNVGGFAVSLSGGGASPMKVDYANVPDELVLLIAQKYNPNLAALAASDTTSAAFQYSTASSGTRTVTFLKQM